MGLRFSSYLRDPRLAAHALSPRPGVALEPRRHPHPVGQSDRRGTVSTHPTGSRTGHTIDPKGSAALQIARLAGTLPHGAAPRLERLRGFGGQLGGALMCACSRVTDRRPARRRSWWSQPNLPGRTCRWPSRRCGCAGRLRRGRWRCSRPTALLLHATRVGAGPAWLAAASLAELGAADLAGEALAAGRAAGDHCDGRLDLARTHRRQPMRPCCWPPSRRPMRAEPPQAPLAEHAATHAVARTGPAAATAHRTTAEPCQQADPLAARSRRPSMPPRAPASAAVPRASAASRCASSGRWTPTAASRSAPTNSIALIGPQTAAALGRAVERDRADARARSRRPGRTRLRLARHLERHHRRLPGRRRRRAAGGRTVRASGVRPRPQLPRLSRLRRLPRRRAHRRADERARQRRAAAAAARPPRVEPPVFRDERRRWPSVPPSENVVPFRSHPRRRKGAPTLTPVERKAFSELASRLTARLRGPTGRAPKTGRRPTAEPPSRAIAADRHRADEAAAPRARRRAADATSAPCGPPPISVRSSTGCRSACWSIGSTS